MSTNEQSPTAFQGCMVIMVGGLLFFCIVGALAPNHKKTAGIVVVPTPTPIPTVSPIRKAELKRLEELRIEREAKLVSAGVEDPPELDITSEKEMRKQMRIEGLDPEQDIVDIFKDTSARLDNVRPLKKAATYAKFSHEDGEVLMLDELAGFQKGDAMLDVMESFDAPDHRGATNDVEMYRLGWPDLMYYSYDSADVTFLVKDGMVDLILVGLVYRDRGNQ